MKRVLVLGLLAVAGLFAAGSTAKADHFRHVGHHHHHGGYGGGYRGYSHHAYRPGVSIGLGYGAPVYGQAYYGGGYRYPSYGYGAYYAPAPVYAPVYGYGGGCRY